MLSEFKEGHTMSLAYSDKELAIREELANSMDIHPDATSHYRTYPSIRDYYEGNRKDKNNFIVPAAPKSRVKLKLSQLCRTCTLYK